MERLRIIHCIGDSHAGFFSGLDRPQPDWPRRAKDALPGFRTYRLGPVLAYHLATPGTTTGGCERLAELLAGDVPAEARVMLCLGEIDCRAHLLRQVRERGRDLDEVVEDCVERYFRAVWGVQARGFEVLVWNAIPSTVLEGEFDKEYPAIGTCEERNEAARRFNEAVRRRAGECGATFVSIFDRLVDERGRTRAEFYRPDRIHLSQRAMPMALEALSAVATDLDLQRPLPYRLYVSPPGRAVRAAWRRAGEGYDAARRTVRRAWRRRFGTSPPPAAVELRQAA